MTEIENYVLESETVLNKRAQLRGEIDTFLKKPTKLPEEMPSRQTQALKHCTYKHFKHLF